MVGARVALRTRTFRTAAPPVARGSRDARSVRRRAKLAYARRDRRRRLDRRNSRTAARRQNDARTAPSPQRARLAGEACGDRVVALRVPPRGVRTGPRRGGRIVGAAELGDEGARHRERRAQFRRRVDVQADGVATPPTTDCARASSTARAPIRRRRAPPRRRRPDDGSRQRAAVHDVEEGARCARRRLVLERDGAQRRVRGARAAAEGARRHGRAHLSSAADCKARTLSPSRCGSLIATHRHSATRSGTAALQTRRVAWGG